MHRAWLVVLVLAAAGACRDEQLARLEAIRDEVCACKTASCGKAALDKVPQGEITSNHRSQRVAAEMLSCLAELNESDRPTTDPDAEQPPPETPDPAPPDAP